MKAIASDTYGPPDEVLHLRDLDVPSCGAGDVVVRVRAASVNPADWHLVRGEPRIARLQLGLRRPRHAVLGCDVAGTVHELGPGVTGVRPGDEVYGSPFMRGFGGFAEYARVPADCLAPRPAGLSHEQAAAVPLAGLTALQGLRDVAGVAAGQAVLVVGASGGVGTFAVQVARALGAEVTAVCSTPNVDLARSLGAAHVIDRTREDVTAGDRRYDVILQVTGTLPARALRRRLTPRGTLVQVSGDSPGTWLGAVGRLVRGRLGAVAARQTVTGVTVVPRAADLAYLGGLLEAGTVRPVIDRTYPLDRVPEALRYLEAGRARGKVVVAPVP